jgi:hypothetical protein
MVQLHGTAAPGQPTSCGGGSRIINFTKQLQRRRMATAAHRPSPLG